VWRASQITECYWQTPLKIQQKQYRQPTNNTKIWRSLTRRRNSDPWLKNGWKITDINRDEIFQYSETNGMHILFSLLRSKGIYMFLALLAHTQEALYKRHLVYFVRVMSFGCTRIESCTCNGNVYPITGLVALKGRYRYGSTHSQSRH
jgi:hypothetical protein